MTPDQNKKKTVFGAVSVEGRLYCSIQPRKRAVSFLAFVKQLLQRAAKAGHGVLLILDHYDIHTAKVVARFVAETEGRVQVVWLPSYCPNDNSQEEVWSHVQPIVWCSRHSFRIE
ncbi:MAG: transposase [Armatimonadota bacterium]|jgi:transposase